MTDSAPRSVSPHRKVFDGVVVSTKMKDTLGVLVTRWVRHPLYKKTVKRTRTFLVHSTDKGINVGDHVKIREIKPISKRKYFEMLEVVKK